MSDAAQAQPDTLREEIAFLEEHKAEWIQHYAGDFILVKGSKLIGHYSTFEAAYRAAVTAFGKEPVLIKQLVEDEPRVDLPALATGMIHARL